MTLDLMFLLHFLWNVNKLFAHRNYVLHKRKIGIIITVKFQLLMGIASYLYYILSFLSYVGFVVISDFRRG